MRNKTVHSLLSLLMALFVAGCVSGGRNVADLQSTQREEQLQADQKTIRNGMSQDEVKRVLGNPSMVVQNAEGKEVWTYSRIASQVIETKSCVSGGAAVGAAGMIGSAFTFGGFSASGEKHVGGKAQTEKNITVMVTFGKNGCVESISCKKIEFGG